MTQTDDVRSPYIIHGGTPGRERLRVLAAAVRPTTLTLLDRAGLSTTRPPIPGSS
jgi:hypothetical protein